MDELLSNKTNRAGNDRSDRTVQDDLNAYFAVLTVLREKFDEYAATPRIPIDR